MFAVRLFVATAAVFVHSFLFFQFAFYDLFNSSFIIFIGL
jgi:hypothetical protein